MTQVGDNPSGPLVSVVIATLNARHTLQRTIASILEQTHARREIVIADGGSTDGTIELLGEYGDAIAHWQSGSDTGIYDAWNKALPHVRGEWLYFMGADDELADVGVLESMVEGFDRARERGIRVVYGQVEVVNAAGGAVMTVGRPWPEVRDEFRYRQMAIPHQGCFTRRDVFADHGQFDASYRIAGDYELLLRELSAGDALFVPRLVARMGIDGASNSITGAYRSFEEQTRARRKHGLEPGRASTRVKGILWGALVRAAPLVGEHRVRRVFDLYLQAVGKPKRWTV